MSKSKPRLPGFLEAKSIPGLLGRSVLLLVLPYAYLMLCGLVFDHLLKWYFMTGFIFWSLLALYALAVGLILWMTVRFVKNKKRGV